MYSSKETMETCLHLEILIMPLFQASFEFSAISKTVEVNNISGTR
jgi:hypothetical protein